MAAHRRRSLVSPSPAAPRAPTAGVPGRAWLASAALGSVAAVGAAALAMAPPTQGRKLVFASLGEALAEAERLGAARQGVLVPAGVAWNLPQTLAHCAQSIEYSLRGFPAPKPALFQALLGRPAFHAFAWHGRMTHDLAEPIPGAPALAEGQPRDAPFALARLRHAVHAFSEHAGALQPHFAYGALDRRQYEHAHAMHLANHLSVFDVA